MMELMPGDIRRFVLAMPSIPHLEAILLLRGEPGRAWNANAIARNLYMSEDTASRVMKHLCFAGICMPVPDRPDLVVYQPDSVSIDDLIGRVASFYSHNLIEVTNIIHANSGQEQVQKIRQLADAFNLQKDE